MEAHKIHKNLASMNLQPNAEAMAAFLDCCGSSEWAFRMVAARPFPMVKDLFEKAEKIWLSLRPADWLEAFAAHPKIGSKKPAPSQKARAAKWSSGEQSGLDAADAQVRKELAEANGLYEDKFGFIFIVCASGKTAQEMLAICRTRLGNTLETELNIAAGEQLKITEIRLNRLLDQ